MTEGCQRLLSGGPRPVRNLIFWLAAMALAGGGEWTAVARQVESQPPASNGNNDARFWSQFRGPNGQGAIAESGIPSQFGPNQHLLWKTEIGGGQSSPVIWGDLVFVTTVDDESPGRVSIVCLDRERGGILWSRTVEGREKVKYYPTNGPASPTPVADRQHVYVYFGNYGLLCYDHAGEQVWERQIDPPASQYGMAASPILYRNRLILVVDDDNRDSRLMAIDCNTGKLIWEKPRPLFKAGWSTPMIWKNDLREELVVLGFRRLTSYDPNSGEELWWAGGFSTETIGIPVAGERFLFVSDAALGGRGETRWDAEASWKTMLEDFDKNGDGRIQRAEVRDGFRFPLRPDLSRDEPGAALPIGPRRVDGWIRNIDKDQDGELSADDWHETMSAFGMASKPTLMAIKSGATGNARSSSVAWEVHTGIPEIPSPVLGRGRIYLLRDGGAITCVEASSGKLLFRGRIGAGGQYVASPIIAGDRVITASKRGVVTVLQIGDKLEILARNDFGEQIMATPAITDNKIYIRTARHLYAIGK